MPSSSFGRGKVFPRAATSCAALLSPRGRTPLKPLPSCGLRFELVVPTSPNPNRRPATSNAPHPRSVTARAGAAAFVPHARRHLRDRTMRHHDSARLRATPATPPAPAAASRSGINRRPASAGLAVPRAAWRPGTLFRSIHRSPAQPPHPTIGLHAPA
jgi:hypothetical protein